MRLFRIALPLLAFSVSMVAAPPTVADAKAFMDRAEADLLKMTVLQQRAQWVQETYITDDTELLAANADERVIALTTDLINESRKFDSLALPADLKRKFLLLRLSLTMPAPKDPKLREELTQVAASLDGSYGKGKYCPGGEKEPCYGIDDLEEKMAKSRDPKEIAAIWTGWHKVGAPMRTRYARFVELSNQGARELGFADTGALWRSGYDMTPEQFSADLERVWSEVAPLYQELHTYMRRKLIQKYGAVAERKDGMIPAHLLGNMWAQEWGNVYDLAAPPAAPASYDVGAILQQRKTTAKQVVQYGEGFFRSLGLESLPDSFWQRSQLTRPRDRDVVCHASAWHMDLDKDVRLKVCLHDTTDDFVTVHHELGHVYYFLAYRNQPFLFRNGANDGFHEAIGDAIALSITPEYLKKIGLIDKIPPPQADLPLLLRTAMDKIAFLPFGLMIDKWRWEVFSGKVKPADYNKAWWQLREQYQGVAPPVDRSEADFDPGAKYHIPSNTPYARYFLARIYQFQFYRAMCRAAGYTGPLNRCSVFGSKAAGAKLQAMLQMGASKPWPEAMKAMTGEDRIDASAMMEYFQPLLTWLKEQNKGEKKGWTVAADPMKAR
ncbi:MAG TPA: M2 family metallopeptidase [Bryobacteraceae bacterium]|jgi:peptidyl-dipeptidase A|nr:M2 family metallopeptidase [Bryobacteraceae bacterium]